MEKKVGIACIIDDDDVYIFGVKKLIQIKGLCDNLMVFKNGKEALNYLSSIFNTPNLLPDVILLDINMPEMNGWQFAEEFTKLNHQPEKKITVYMVSSSIDPKDEERAKSLSVVSNYYLKPITLYMLTGIFEAAAA